MRETLSSKKALIITLAVGLVLIGAILVYGILVTPARQPYRDALTQYQNTNNALARTSISVNAGSASEDDFKKGIEAVRASLKSLEVENEALGKEEVLTDGEGKALYEAYNKDVKRYVAYNGNVVTSMEMMRPILVKCTIKNDTGTVSATDAALMQTCADELTALETIPDEDYAHLAESLEPVYAQLAVIFGKMATTDAKSSEYQSLVGEWNAQNEAYSDASATFSKDVQSQRKAILNTSSANDLKSYLEAKSRIF